MGRNKVNTYLDVVHTHPDFTDEELEQFIQEEERKSAELTDWEKM